MAHRRVGRPGRRAAGHKAPPYVLSALLLLGTAACGVRAAGPPAIEVDRSGCSHCGMLVSEPVYAAAYRVAGGEARIFDDIGCMAAALRKEKQADRRVWVHDFETGGWIDGDRAVYVHAGSFHTPMGGGFIALRTFGAAERIAEEKKARVLSSLDDVLAFSGKEEGQ